MVDALLNAKDFGVPQDRTRYFLVGSRDGVPFSFPQAGDRMCPTVEDAIRDLPQLENGDLECWRRYGPRKPSAYAKVLRRNRKGCHNHLVTRNAPYVIERYQHVSQGGNWEAIPAHLMKNYADRTRCHTGIYHRLRSDRASVVIGNFRKNMLIHPHQHRGLSVREAARIQSFPDWFRFYGSIGFQQQQVGNAVPPRLAQVVFDAIVCASSSGEQ
jgi:DNA (cytosine-5)-methyltransferase 1